ncbi:RHS repeat domain-containing protein [Cecembia calidifontis]|uniref:RHS repeat-associated protein n=1 Tax=Cecembia calidifontis TaxID=1187080 RepID=A0A4Q7PD61_9BACT|nr:RHS repeat-associated core domain-containing protein [Cecembia calidifontis]RZS98017.1 RHS repeat-associated protein [Cecembia calidifontis]
MASQLNELGQQYAGSGPNQLLLANAIMLVLSELNKKPVPEAYMAYALYDRDSNQYDSGKILLSKKARNKHEELKKDIFVEKDGYIEAFVVNETSENVWYDNFSIQSTGPIVVQETHYDPWGVELQGLGYQEPGIKVNKYLYNGNEILSDLNLNLYDFKSRFYDPVIGRFISIDVLADHPNQIGLSPYQFSWNNPIRYNDPDGKCPSCWPTFYAAYQGMKAKYSGILSQANAPVQRLISRDSGSTPSNIGMNETTRAAIRITGVSSDLNEITSVGKTLAQEAAIDVGDVLDKGGEVISAGGLASTPITGPLGLTVMKFGDGVSAFGASSKGIGYIIAGEYNLAGAEFTKAGVSATTGYSVGKAVDVSKRVGNAAVNDIAQESILQTINKGVNKISNYVIDFLYGEREEK